MRVRSPFRPIHSYPVTLSVPYRRPYPVLECAFESGPATMTSRLPLFAKHVAEPEIRDPATRHLRDGDGGELRPFETPTAAPYESMPRSPRRSQWRSSRSRVE